MKILYALLFASCLYTNLGQAAEISMTLACNLPHIANSELPQANAPRYTLSCGSDASFGIAFNCASVEITAIFPSVKSETIALMERARTASHIVYVGKSKEGESVTVVVSPKGEDTTAEISSGALQTECSARQQ